MQRVKTRDILSVKEWHTPASDYPLSKVGSAELTRSPYKRGYYHHEGINGYLFYRVEKPIPVTCLSIDGKEWMVDDPLHWHGTQAWASHCHSRTLVAGLGLGLVVHALVARAVRFTVVEQSQDVIDLISPLLPDGDYEIVNASWYDYVKDHGRNYEWLYWDLAVGDGDSDEVKSALAFGHVFWNAFMPNAHAVFFGQQGWDGPAWYHMPSTMTMPAFSVP